MLNILYKSTYVRIRSAKARRTATPTAAAPVIVNDSVRKDGVLSAPESRLPPLVRVPIRAGPKPKSPRRYSVAGSHFACSPIHLLLNHSLTHWAGRRKHVEYKGARVHALSGENFSRKQLGGGGGAWGSKSTFHPSQLLSDCSSQTLICIIEEVFDLASPIGRRTKLRERFYRSVVPK